MAQAFFGRYTCPLDEKNRAVLAMRLRDAIEPEKLRDGFMITMGFEGCLILFLRDRWKELTREIEKIPFTDPGARLFKRFFFSSAAEVPIDKVGRINIADFQKEIAGIDREAIFNGMGDHIEIWAPDRWKKYCDENAGRYGDVASRLLGAQAQALGDGASLDGEVG